MIATHEMRVLTGRITVTESDRKGNPLEIGIETDDFLTYVITCKKRGKELFNCISRKVVITCQMEGRNYYGNSLISITDYSLLNEDGTETSTIKK